MLVSDLGGGSLRPRQAAGAPGVLHDVEAALSKPMEFDARSEAVRLSRISLQLDRATF